MAPREARNPHCSCRKFGAWTSKAAADRALQRVLDSPHNPHDPRPYRPTRVVRCTKKAGVWHLTTNAGKPWKHGKRRR